MDIFIIYNLKIYICVIVTVVPELADKNPTEVGRFSPKYVKDDRLNMLKLSVTLDVLLNLKYKKIYV
jgi:hypothetical protein